jgi:glycerol-3-phosphate dehydrogenase
LSLPACLSTAAVGGAPRQEAASEQEEAIQQYQQHEAAVARAAWGDGGGAVDDAAAAAAAVWWQGPMEERAEQARRQVSAEMALTPTEVLLRQLEEVDAELERRGGRAWNRSLSN